jgi:hypothetical protein
MLMPTLKMPEGRARLVGDHLGLIVQTAFPSINLAATVTQLL